MWKIFGKWQENAKYFLVFHSKFWGSINMFDFENLNHDINLVFA